MLPNWEVYSQESELYLKFSQGGDISTSVGRDNPDWAIAFYEGKVKIIFFAAETKNYQ